MPKQPQRHTRLKRRAAGPRGQTEKKQPGGTRLDARRPGQAIEVERSKRFKQALGRLAKEKGVKRTLKVPHHDFDSAVEAAKRTRMPVTVTNLSDTRRKSVNR